MERLKILITGGNGFIGSHLVDRLISLGHQVSVVDLAGKGYHLDIRSAKIAGLMARLKPAIVYHLAADNRVTGSVQDIINCNVIGTFNVLEACRLAKIKRFVFTSSAAVYGDSKKLPIKEIWPNRPISAYGISKLTDELYCRLFDRYFPSTIFRFANVYGPRQSSAAEGGVVAIFVNRILSGKPIVVYGNGKQTRDFIYVDDVVDALVMVLKKPVTTVLNIGSNLPTPIDQLIKLVETATGKKAEIEYRPKRPAEIEKSLFSYNKASRVLGWRPKTGLSKGVNETVNYYLTGLK